MLRVLKNTGRVASSANDKVSPNTRGRVELTLSRQENGDPRLQYVEYGNYGKARWSTTVQLTREEVESMMRSCRDWLAGTVEVTLEAQPEAERAVQVTEEAEETFEVVNGNR